jgi:hypothetical protein
MLELKQALPMGESEDDDSRIQHYGFGHARDVELSRSKAEETEHKMHTSKPFIPRTFPSLLDSSMSSSYSVSAPPSASPSFDNCTDVVQREGSKEEREDTLTMNTNYTPTMELIEEPLAIEVPLPLPLDGARYVVDLERINEESSGNDVGETSTVSSRATGLKDFGDGGAANNTVAAAMQGGKTPIIQGQIMTAPGNPKPYSMTDTESPTNAYSSAGNNDREQPTAHARTMHDQNIHRHQNQFFNYRHQYYTEQLEQYHYFNDTCSQPTQKGDDDTESTCSSVTLSQAFQPSMQGDDDSCASSMVTESTSHPSLSTVSSVTLSHALSVDRHDHSDQGFYVAVRLGDYVGGPIGEPPEAETVNDEEERDMNETEQKLETNSKADTVSNDDSVEDTSSPSIASPGAATDMEVSSNNPVPASASKQVAKSSNEDVESDILNMLIPECGVPIPSVMAKMGSKKSKAGLLIPWHSTRSIQNYQYGGGRRKKKTGRSDSSLFSISSVHTFRG